MFQVVLLQICTIVFTKVLNRLHLLCSQIVLHKQQSVRYDTVLTADTSELIIVTELLSGLI